MELTDDQAMGLERVPAPEGVRTCRECGCWNEDACWDEIEGACWWVDGDLCSSCAYGWELSRCAA